MGPWQYGFRFAICLQQALTFVDDRVVSLHSLPRNTSVDDTILFWHFRGIWSMLIMLPLGNRRAAWKHVETGFQGAPMSAFSLATILEDAEVSQTEPGGMSNVSFCCRMWILDDLPWKKSTVIRSHWHLEVSFCLSWRILMSDHVRCCSRMRLAASWFWALPFFAPLALMWI